MASTRFPGKPLAPILGVPMIGHVYQRSKLNRSLSEVYVATCDEEIATYIHSIGGRVIMTSPTHQRASDRVAEALTAIERETKETIDAVVLIQGDEPMIVPEMIDESASPLASDSSVVVTNLCGVINDGEEFRDPNEIKVVIDRNGDALYFSREPIPSSSKYNGNFRRLKQICVITFRRDFMYTYSRLEPTPMELIESIDMLRVLEHGYKVKMVFTSHQVSSVDTPDDLTFVETLMVDDPLRKVYAA